jgi:hypothetical protein
MGELNLIKQPWIRVYSLAGISFRSIETSRRLSQDFVDKEEVVKTEPILTMNHDLGLGVEVPLNKDLTLGFAYRSSQSMTADGQYRQEIRQTDSFGARVLSSETRAEYKDFRYQMREFVISLSLQSSSQN